MFFEATDFVSYSLFELHRQSNHAMHLIFWLTDIEAFYASDRPILLTDTDTDISVSVSLYRYRLEIIIKYHIGIGNHKIQISVSVSVLVKGIKAFFEKNVFFVIKSKYTL